jgi:DNA-binding MarR family transcriptional regulator
MLGPVTPHRTPATADAVSDALMPSIGALRRLLRRAAGPMFTSDTVSTSQREVLAVVGAHPGSPVADIAQELGLAPNSVSTIVTQLVGAGLLVRETDPHDRRVGRLTLTPQAQEQAVVTRARRRGVLHDALDRLTPRQVAELAAGIDALGALAEELRALERDREAVHQ